MLGYAQTGRLGGKSWHIYERLFKEKLWLHPLPGHTSAQKVQQDALELYSRLHSKMLPTCTSKGHCRQFYFISKLPDCKSRLTTFPCKGRQWSSFLSSFQESIWTSASPRKVFLPKRPWCQTENCNVLWARRNSGISYCEKKKPKMIIDNSSAKIIPKSEQPVPKSIALKIALL